MRKYSHLKLTLLVTFALAVMVSVATWCFLATPFGNARASGPDGTASNVSLDRGVADSPVPGGPGFHSMSVFEFVSPIGGCTSVNPELWNWSGSSYCTAAAPVSLPDGVTVTKLVLYFWDNSDNDLSATLYRLPLDGSSAEEMAGTSSDGSPGYGYSETTSIGSPLIDQQAYAYYVDVPLPPATAGELRLRGVRIDYGYGLNLPLVTRDD